MKQLIFIISFLIFTSCQNDDINVDGSTNQDELLQTLIITKSEPNSLELLNKSPINNGIIQSENRFLLSSQYFYDSNKYNFYYHYKFRFNDSETKKHVNYIDLGYDLAANKETSNELKFDRYRWFDPFLNDSSYIDFTWINRYNSYNDIPLIIRNSGNLSFINSSKQINSFSKSFNLKAPLKITNSSLTINRHESLKLNFNRDLNPSYDVITFSILINNTKLYRNFRFLKKSNFLTIPSDVLKDFFNEIKTFSNENSFAIQIYIISSGEIIDFFNSTITISNKSISCPIIVQQVSRYSFQFE